MSFIMGSKGTSPSLVAGTARVSLRRSKSSFLTLFHLFSPAARTFLDISASSGIAKWASKGSLAVWKSESRANQTRRSYAYHPPRPHQLHQHQFPPHCRLHLKVPGLATHHQHLDHHHSQQLQLECRLELYHAPRHIYDQSSSSCGKAPLSRYWHEAAVAVHYMVVRFVGLLRRFLTRRRPRLLHHQWHHPADFHKYPPLRRKSRLTWVY